MRARGARHDRFTVDRDGWLVDDGLEVARRVSPNQDARPDDEAPTLVVIHNISLPPGCFGGEAIEALFMNALDCDAHPYYDALRHLRVSSHVLVRRDGAIVQFVSCDRRAWHAGASCFEGRERCNDFSIGIELEGDDTTPFEDVQYARAAALVDALAARYPIDAMAGHSDIAPGRKTDPGPCFDWNFFLSGLRCALRGPHRRTGL